MPVHRPSPVRTVRSRITGVDAARGLALIGMFVAHVAPATGDQFWDSVISVADERPRLLFALTAGVGLGLLTGGVAPVREPIERMTLRRQIAIRAVLLIALGILVVVALRPLVLVILDVYGVAFLVVLPLLFLPWRTAVLLGAGLLVVTPAIVELAARPSGLLELADGPAGILVEWFLLGAYPVVIWVPVMLIGLGLARAGIGRPSTLAWAAIAAAAILPLTLPIARLLPGPDDIAGMPETTVWSIPLRASLETVGNTAVGVLVLAGTCALLGLAAQPVRRVAGIVLSPIVAMGAMPLTIYTLHLVVIANAKYVRSDGVVSDDSWALLIGLVVGSALFAWTWRRYVGIGPLERFFRWASGRDRADPVDPPSDPAR
ncbi:heparan-alpha-glucosaminide N-acetyltransferase domain-containing protein [Agromyces sp. M3QZ16-3]|uniref:heparan-alpha-glucosaminide N-acetyltransferase domain-containing protein n=1 Tax=Agromyces sp. M3QZ16-3 TaxID=3447585 RepID=UPI003F694731